MFRNKRVLVVLALAVVVIMTVMSPLALAKSTKVPAPAAAAKKAPATGSTELINATRKLGQAILFWRAAVWFNDVGPTQYGVAYNFPVDEWSAQIDEATALYAQAMNMYKAGNISQARSLAVQVFNLANGIKDNIEATIHAGGRSVGEYKHNKPGKKVLIFGSDELVCYGVAFQLEQYGIEYDVSIDVPLNSWNLDNYYTMIFDPEYRLYGQATYNMQGSTTGVWAWPGTYGGLSPDESAYLESYLSKGILGLVYMEPYFHMVGDGCGWPCNPPAYFVNNYCEKGQIPFIDVDMNAHANWVNDPVVVNVNPNPITEGVNTGLELGSYGEWTTLALSPNQPMISNVEVALTTNAGPDAYTFNYGTGRVVLLGLDTNNALAGVPTFVSPDWARLMSNATEWAGFR